MTEFKGGQAVRILKPIPPHYDGNAIVTKAGFGIACVMQKDICFWYDNECLESAEESKLCDQYKEAISEATEDIKESACSRTHNRDAIDHQLSEIFKKQSTSTTMFPNGITGLSSGNWGNLSTALDSNLTVGRTFMRTSPNNQQYIVSKEQAELLKKGLALLAEQKQNELKEIEELIKKL